jgi:WD40 repeat protein
MQMDWISLLKAQQADFLQRIKKPKTYELSLLESQVKGCHSEIIAFSGDPLLKIVEFSRQQAEIIAKNPPPAPPDYPEAPDWVIPFPKYFQQQVQDYIAREEIVRLVIAERLGKLVKKLPQDTLQNMVLDDEGNLRGESKFSYVLTDHPKLSIQVYAADGESFNGIKKNKIKWTVTQQDFKNYEVLIFLCLFYPSTSESGYQKHAIVAGFLPTNQINFTESKLYVNPSNLLYAGGLSWYLESLTTKKNLKKDTSLLDESNIAETIQTLPSEHPQKQLVGDWECWQTLKGHRKGIYCLAFSSRFKNGKTAPILASGSLGEIKLWDLTKGELIETLSDYPWVMSGQVNQVNSLAFSADGQILVSAGADSTIKIWHIGALDLIDILHKHNGMVRCVAFAPNGLMLVTAGDDRKVLFWDLIQRQAVIALSLDDTAAHSLVLSQDGQTLVTGSYRKIKVWHTSQRPQAKILKDSPPLHTLTGHSHIVPSLAITADAQLLVSGSWDQTIKIWHLGTGKLIRTLKGHSDKIYTIALSPDEKIIASGSADQSIKLWHLQTGELLATFTGHSHTITDLAFTDSGEMLVSASLDKTIKIWQRS